MNEHISIDPVTGEGSCNGKYRQVSKQEACKYVLGLAKKTEAYLKSFTVDKLYDTSNIRLVKDNKITVDDYELIRDDNNKHLFTNKSGTLVFNINDFTFKVNTNATDVKPQDICRYVTQKYGKHVFYPRSLKVKNIYTNDNISEILTNEIEVDRERYVQSDDHPNVYISEDFTCFDIETFKFMPPQEFLALDHPNWSKQQIAQAIMKTDKLVYPKNINTFDLLRKSNLAIVDDDTFTTNRVRYTLIPNTMIGMSASGLMISLEKFSAYDSNNVINCDINLLIPLRAIMNTDKLVYPISTSVPNKLLRRNLRIINDHEPITIDRIPYYYCSSLDSYVRYTCDQKFNFQTWTYEPVSVSGSDIVQIAKDLLNTDELVYPTSKSALNAIKLENIRKLPDKFPVLIDKSNYYYLPEQTCLFRNTDLTTINLNDWSFGRVQLSETVTMQRLAQIVKETDQLVVPLSINVQYILLSKNLVLLSECTQIKYNSMSYYKSPDSNIFISRNKKYSFDIITFKVNELDSLVIDQAYVQNMFHDNSKLYYPRRINVNGVVKADPSNFEPVEEVMRVNKVKYTQHPYFKNLIGNKKGEVIDLNTFNFINDPALNIKLAFITKSIYIIDDEHVYHKDTNTVNYEPINWNNITETKPISSIRFIHPIYNNYGVDFYGRPFIIKFDTDNESERIEYCKETSVHSNIVLWHEGSKITMSMKRFIYECFNNTTLDTKDVISSNPNIKLPDSIYYNCKWNLIKTTFSSEDSENRLLYHPSPKFARYAYDTETNKICSVSKTGEAKFISSWASSLMLSDITMRYSLSNRVLYPKGRFIYECINNVVLNENEFIVENKLHRIGEPTIVIDGVTFNVSPRNNLFYISENKQVFYVKYEKLVKVVDDEVILSNTCSDHNINMSELL